MMPGHSGKRFGRQPCARCICALTRSEYRHAWTRWLSVCSAMATCVSNSAVDKRVTVYMSKSEIKKVFGYEENKHLDYANIDQNYSQVKVRFIPNGVYDFPIGDIGGVCCDSDDVLSGSRGALIYLTVLNAPRIPALPWALCCLSNQRSGGRNTSCFDRVQFSGYTKRLRYDVSS